MVFFLLVMESDELLLICGGITKKHDVKLHVCKITRLFINMPNETTL